MSDGEQCYKNLVAASCVSNTVLRITQKQVFKRQYVNNNATCNVPTFKDTQWPLWSRVWLILIQTIDFKSDSTNNNSIYIFEYASDINNYFYNYLNNFKKKKF